VTHDSPLYKYSYLLTYLLTYLDWIGLDWIGLDGAGDVASGRREREADSGGEGTSGGHGVEPEPRPPGRGSHHGIGQPPVLCTHSGRLYDSAADARHSTHEVRLRPRLHSTPAGQHQLQTAAAMGQPDRQRKRSLRQWRIQRDLGDSHPLSMTRKIFTKILTTMFVSAK